MNYLNLHVNDANCCMPITAKKVTIWYGRQKRPHCVIIWIFHDIKRLLPWDFWRTCSTLSAHSLAQRIVNSKNHFLLKILLKFFISEHVTKKLGALTWGDKTFFNVVAWIKCAKIFAMRNSRDYCTILELILELINLIMLSALSASVSIAH